MQLPYFYEENIPISKTLYTLSADTSKHCTQVLRMKTGDKLQLTNGLGVLATATITAAQKNNTVVQIEDIEHKEANHHTITIAISPLKNATRLEWFLEKATEIGVYGIQLIICERTEKQFIKLNRYKGIIIAAMLQSRQTWMPVFLEPIKFNNFIDNDIAENKLIAHCMNDDKQHINTKILSNSCSILIGPEGDFSPKEIEDALQKQYYPVSLGDTRLRTETAGIVAATLIKNKII